MKNVCRCGQRLIWAVTAAGNRMPINAEEDKTGTVAVWQSAGGAFSCRVVSAAEPRRPGEVMHISHFASCPYAEKERKPKTTQGPRSRLSRDPGLQPLF